jgi:uncharacterized protein
MIFDAIRQGNEDEVRALLAAYPALHDARAPQGATPVLWALYTGHAELVPLLLGSRPPDFFEACALGRANRVEELLADNPAMIDTHSPDGFTGLGFACFFHRGDVAKLLLDRGADPGLPSTNALRVAPLHSALAGGLTEIVGPLLARGADPNAREAGGYTPLHSAAGHGHLESIAQLLAAGADPNARTQDGKTPADIARQFGHPEAAAHL